MQSSSRKALAGLFKLRFVAVGILCLVLALAVRHFLNQAASQPHDSTPPQREGIDAPFITTPDLVVERMVELADLNREDLVYDLGCGDGRIVITAALKSGCDGIGIDIDPECIEEAKANAKFHGVEQQVQIIEQDMFTVDLSEADVAMTYLLPWMMNKLLPQFQEMRPGSRIVAHNYWIESVEPEEVFEFVDAEGNLTDRAIYVYRTPLKINPAMVKGKPPRLRDLP